MKKKIKALFKKVCENIFRKKTCKSICKQDKNGTIHIFGDVVVHGSISGKKQLHPHTSSTKFGQE